MEENTNLNVIEETLEQAVEIKGSLNKGVIIGTVVGVTAVLGAVIYKKVIKPRKEKVIIVEQAETEENVNEEE